MAAGIEKAFKTRNDEHTSSLIAKTLVITIKLFYSQII